MRGKPGRRIHYRRPRIVSKPSLIRKPRLNKRTIWLLLNWEWPKLYKDLPWRLNKRQNNRPRNLKNRSKSRRRKLLLRLRLPPQNNSKKRSRWHNLLLPQILSPQTLSRKMTPNRWASSANSNLRRSKNRRRSTKRERWFCKRPKNKLNLWHPRQLLRRFFLNLALKRLKKSCRLSVNQRSISLSLRDIKKSSTKRIKISRN